MTIILISFHVERTFLSNLSYFYAIFDTLRIPVFVTNCVYISDVSEMPFFHPWFPYNRHEFHEKTENVRRNRHKNSMQRLSTLIKGGRERVDVRFAWNQIQIGCHP